MSGLLEKYVPIVGAEVIDHLRHLAEPLRGSRVCMSTRPARAAVWPRSSAG